MRLQPSTDRRSRSKVRPGKPVAVFKRSAKVERSKEVKNSRLEPSTRRTLASPTNFARRFDAFFAGLLDSESYARRTRDTAHCLPAIGRRERRAELGAHSFPSHSRPLFSPLSYPLLSNVGGVGVMRACFLRYSHVPNARTAIN